MKVLGIDPGSHRIGYGVISTSPRLYCIAYGCIQLPKHSNNQLAQIESACRLLIKKHKPDVVSLEKIFFLKNAKTIIPVAETRGVLRLTIQKYKIPLVEPTPLEVKRGLTGYGQAGKEQIQKTIRLILNLDKLPQPDDAADALALALCAGTSHP